MSVGSKWNKYGTAPKDLNEETCQKAFDELSAKVKDLIPLEQHDSSVLSDEDTLIKLLIARKYNVEKAEQMLRDTIQWRKDFGCDHFADWKFDEKVAKKYPCGFYGTDIEKHPLYFECIDGSALKELLQEFGPDVLFKWHVYTVERQRQAMKHFNSDRISILLNIIQVPFTFVANTQVIGFLNRISAHDQKTYPEGLRFMLIVNAPGVVSGIWKLISPLIDPVVREKIHIWGSDYMKQISPYTSITALPSSALDSSSPSGSPVGSSDGSPLGVCNGGSPSGSSTVSENPKAVYLRGDASTFTFDDFGMVA